MRAATQRLAEFVAADVLVSEIPVSQTPQPNEEVGAIALPNNRDVQQQAVRTTDARAIAQVAYQFLLQHAIQRNETDAIVANYRICLMNDSLKVTTLDGRSVVEVDREKSITDTIESVDIETFKQIHQQLLQQQARSQDGHEI